MEGEEAGGREVMKFGSLVPDGFFSKQSDDQKRREGRA